MRCKKCGGEKALTFEGWRCIKCGDLTIPVVDNASTHTFIPKGWIRIPFKSFKNKEPLPPETMEGIHHPPHYTRGGIEVWDFILDQDLSYLLGNVVKYVCRAGYKGLYIEDLEKARAYLDKAISDYKKKMELGLPEEE